MRYLLVGFGLCVGIFIAGTVFGLYLSNRLSNDTASITAAQAPISTITPTPMEIDQGEGEEAGENETIKNVEETESQFDEVKLTFSKLFNPLVEATKDALDHPKVRTAINYLIIAVSVVLGIGLVIYMMIFPH